MPKRRGHGEGSVYPRKDGRFAGYIRLEGGKKKYFYGNTRKEVQDKVRAALNEKERGTLATGPNPLLKDYLPEWLETVCKPPYRAPQTYISYRSVISKHLIPEIGHLKIRNLTARHIQNLYTKKIREGAKPATIEQMQKVLSGSLNSALQWEMVSTNVASKITTLKGEQREILPLTEEEAKVLLETARGHRLEGMILLGVTLGLRLGEITALKWKNIDLDAHTLTVKLTVSHVPSMSHVEKDPKTRASRRKIDLPNAVVQTLRQHYDEQKAEAEKMGLSLSEWNPKGLVFLNKRRGYMYAGQTRKEFYAILAQAGLPKMHFHDLRHSAATILLVKGVHPKMVQELLGHSSIVMTMNIYSHVMPSMRKEVAGIMDTIFSEKKEEDKP
ncbi:tyrosine-type recombinase/integrase [Ktedonobacter racemifer]|uniref:Integrase family protein n=1 Tax=Ktedonobacter racemifer DSM 44963 TaxID=485913 RepID=D6TH70_KTERA|nr:tyrosine-type recombinase/integrase [Ktedonobacter racemifer]EFH90812.1 integrase family protein [Ktedonobacter racemifer DSM 44963]